MKNFILLLALTSLFSFSSSAETEERTPFTNISFGVVFGWGDFIKVENPDYFTADKTHYLIEVNGKNYKEIIAEAKGLYGSDYKCQLAERFVGTMKDLGIEVGNTVDLKLYLFGAGHKVITVKDVPVTEDNLFDLQFETSFCN